MGPLDRAFDPELFRAEGHATIDLLADHLARAHEGAMPVLPWRAPEDSLAAWPPDFPELPPAEGGDAALRALFARAIDGSIHLHHPRYVGHQVTAPLPRAALAELVSALLNNGMGVYEMGPPAVAMELAVVRWMCGALGMGPRSGGVLTSGGSLGNLTALLAARQAKAGWDAWGKGSSAGPPLAVLVSKEAHYSALRAVKIMGMGEGGAVLVPRDERFRMRSGALADAKRAAEAEGRRVFAVVASACSTSTGAYDPLPEVADFCAREGLWLHVDGAHGASAALSPRYRHLVEGIERADSVVWDCHKMMLIPALVTGVLFKEEDSAYGAFAQEASYLFAGDDPRAEWFNVSTRTLECTKRMMGFEVYATLALTGTKVLAEYVERTFDLARRFAEMIRAAGDFELGHEPSCNILCFRHLPAGLAEEARDAHQADVRRRILAGGRFYLVQTKLPEGTFLRVTLMSPKTTEADLAALLDEVRG